jgi:DNA-directed RNA polymerase subunit RPC12/RpoP
VNSFNFTQNFPDENAGIAHFKAQQEQNGVVCSKCSKEHIWLKNKLNYECKHCYSRWSLRSGTVLEHTKLSFRYGYVAMYFPAFARKSISVSEVQRQLGHKRYQPRPRKELLNKLRDVTGRCDSKYLLEGQIELDNAFITTLIPEDRKDKRLKRGAGSQNQSKVVVMTESTVVENPKPGKKSKRVNHLNMHVIDDLKADTITDVVRKRVDNQAEITFGDSIFYNKLGTVVKSHEARFVKPEDLPKILPWVHVAIGNVKRLLLDMHHQMAKEYLQYYLKEFCYKFNHRHFSEKLFDRKEFCYKFNHRYFGEKLLEQLVTVAAGYPTDFKSRIYIRTNCG